MRPFSLRGAQYTSTCWLGESPACLFEDAKQNNPISTENFYTHMDYAIDSIKVDLQTVGFDTTPELVDLVERELRRIMRFRKDVVAADFYFNEDGTNSENNKVARWRLGIPGKDLFAEARSSSWGGSLREAGEKLRRQFVD